MGTARKVSRVESKTVRVLIVEDNKEMGSSLLRGFREQGMEPFLATTGLEALARLAKESFDVVVLDGMLPDRDGLEIVRHVRAKGLTTPVLFLTARSSVEDRVAGLDAGADDYLVKPFSFAELSARLRALVRRGGESTTAIIEIDDLRLDLHSRLVSRGGKPIELSEMQFQLLAYLARHQGEVVSRKMILDHVWDPSTEGLSNVVDVYINRLRNKIDRDFEKPLIHTLRGVGYVLKAE
jgi:two-component system OmpR family response regulator